MTKKKTVEAAPLAEAAVADAAVVVTAYKGFDAGLICRDFQYEIGKTYTHEGPVLHCKSGFHACENPLNIFDYYAPGQSRFAVVKMGGTISREINGDTKIASASITIEAEIGIPIIVGKAIEWITALCKPDANHATGDRSASSATGDRSASSATGIAAVALNAGLFGKAMAADGGAIVLCAHDVDGNLLHIRAARVGDNGIKANVFYSLNLKCEFVEVAP